MTSGIYILLNRQKAKAYVGKSKNIQDRFSQHRQNFRSRPDGFPMYNDDIEDFDFIVTIRLSEEEYEDKGWLYELLTMRECLLLHFDLYNQYPKGRIDIDWTILSKLSQQMGICSGVNDSIVQATGLYPVKITEHKESLPD